MESSNPYPSPAVLAKLEASAPNRLVRLPEVLRLTGLSRASVYLRISRQEFPASFLLQGQKVAVWSELEIQQWIAGQIAARTKPSHSRDAVVG